MSKVYTEQFGTAVTRLCDAARDLCREFGPIDSTVSIQIATEDGDYPMRFSFTDDDGGVNIYVKDS